MSYKLVSLYIGDGEYYTRIDADAVIAELKEKLKNSRNARKYWRKEYLIEYKECCSQKHKRCLAMARLCKAEVDAIKNGYIRSSIISRDGVITTYPPECNQKFSFYSKWHKRWLAIAEQFKEAK